MAYSNIDVVKRSPIDELIFEISHLLHSSNLDFAYEKYQELTDRLSLETEVSNKTLEDIRKLNNFFLEYIESSKNKFPKILNNVDSLISRANLALDKGELASAKKMFFSIQSYYEKVPALLYDEKMFLYDKLFVLKKDIISKESDLIQSSVEKIGLKFSNLKKEISNALSHGNINEAQQNLSHMIELHDSLPKSQNLLKVKFHKEILLFQYEISFARNLEYNSERLKNNVFNISTESGDTDSNSDNDRNSNLDKMKKVLKNIPKIVNPVYSSEPENPELIFDDPDEASIDEIPRVAADYDAKEAFNKSTEAIKEELAKRNDYDVEPYERKYGESSYEESQDVYVSLKEDNPNNPLFNYVSPILSKTYIKRKFDYDERLSFAIDAYNGKDYIKAKELFEIVLKEAPDNVRAQQMVSVLNELISGTSA